MDTKGNDPDLMTTEDAADMLGVHVDTVRRMIKDGRLSSVKLGHRTVRVKRSELMSYIRTAARDGSARAPGAYEIIQSENTVRGAEAQVVIASAIMELLEYFEPLKGCSYYEKLEEAVDRILHAIGSPDGEPGQEQQETDTA